MAGGLLISYTMEDLYKEGVLFPIDDYLVPGISTDPVVQKKDGNHKHRKMHCNNLDICKMISTTGKYEMPVLAPFNGDVPRQFIPFNAAMSTTSYEVGVHFYIDDYQFERIWRNIDRYYDKLRQYGCVIGPDFSQFGDMSYPMRIWNCFRNKVVSAYLQNKGVKIVPNVTWSLPDSFDYCFDGIPAHSTIAINCTSIIGNNFSKSLWYKGYHEALNRLEPKCIIRYGTKMPGEREDISCYFENERLKMLRNGR